MVLDVGILARAIEKVRHGNLAKRIDRRDPNVPKIVSKSGTDWEPCLICMEEAKKIAQVYYYMSGT